MRAVGPLTPPAPFSPSQSHGGEGGQAIRCYLPGGSEELRGFGFWSLLGLTQAAIHPKTAEANHGDAETRRKTGSHCGWSVPQADQ